MSDPRRSMQYRLVGAVIVFAFIFLGSLMIPPPGPEQQPEGALVIPLHPPEAVSAMTTAEQEPLAQAAPAREAEPPMTEEATAPPEVAPAAPPQRAEAAAPPKPSAEPKPERSAASEPAPVPAPAQTETQAPPSPPPTGLWWIQAASYRQEEMARLGVQRLDDAGIATRLRQVEVSGALVWRLQAGPYTTRDDAEVWVKVVEEKGFTGARVLPDE